MKIKDIKKDSVGYLVNTRHGRVNGGSISGPTLETCKINTVGRKYITDHKGWRYQIVDHWEEDGFPFESDRNYHLFPEKSIALSFIKKCSLRLWLLRNFNTCIDTLSLCELISVSDILNRQKDKETETVISEIETFPEPISQSFRDPDTILADFLLGQDEAEFTGIANDIFATWRQAQTTHERHSIEGVFLTLTGMEFSEYLEECKKVMSEEANPQKEE